MVECKGRLLHPGRALVSGMGIQGVAEVMLPLVRLLARGIAAAQQRQIQYIAEHFMAVFTVIHQRHAVIIPGQIHPLMGTDLKSGSVPGGVLRGRPANAAKLDITGYLIAKHIHRELGPQHTMSLMPVRMGVEFHISSALAQEDPLGQPGIPVNILLIHHGVHALQRCPLGYQRKFPGRFLVIEHFNIPCVAVLVVVHLQNVRRRFGRQRFPFILPVPDRADMSLFVKGHAKLFVGDIVRSHGQPVAGLCFLCQGSASHGRQICQIPCTLMLHILFSLKGKAVHGLSPLQHGGVHPLRLLPHSLVHSLIAGDTLIVNPLDGRARNDIVELEQEHLFPDFVQLLFRICLSCVEHPKD